mmetsp:Transcript_117109/g.311429  ORF Transcript_117109/g.311429 Transcript_117109/m.311429 type:complete len:200 (+) Transcript_117109:164-763(+)
MLKTCTHSRNMSTSARDGKSKWMLDPGSSGVPWTITSNRSTSSGARASATRGPKQAAPSLATCTMSWTKAKEHWAKSMGPPSWDSTIRHSRVGSTAYRATTCLISPEGVSDKKTQGQPRRALRTKSVTMSCSRSLCSWAPENAEASPVFSRMEAEAAEGEHDASDLGVFRDIGVSALALVTLAGWFMGWPRSVEPSAGA